MLTRSDDLTILLAVVDQGSFSAAADLLSIQVARVSRSVRKIEEQLGVTILNRTTRSIVLTEPGFKFVEEVRAALLGIEQAEQEIIAGDELPSGKLRIDAASPFIFHQIIPLIAPFNSAFPKIEIELTSSENYVDLIEKRADLAIRIGKLSDSTLHARKLGKSLLYIVASPQYLAKSGRPKNINELKSHQLIGFSSSKTLNKWPISGLQSIQPDISASNGETLRQLALAGNGIACLSGFMVKEDLRTGRLISLMEEGKLMDTGREEINAVYYKSSSVARRISIFIDFIQPKLTL